MAQLEFTALRILRLLERDRCSNGKPAFFRVDHVAVCFGQQGSSMPGPRPVAVKSPAVELQHLPLLEYGFHLPDWWRDFRGRADASAPRRKGDVKSEIATPKVGNLCHIECNSYLT
jgi:hypothetical protein